MESHAEPIVAVCGLNRCGTSLVMQMLAAGGVEPSTQASTFPAFEDGRWPRLLTAGADYSWFGAESGRAFKMLDPHLVPDLPKIASAFDFRFIRLTRSPVEQAKSQIKFTRANFPKLGLPIQAWPRYKKAIEKDEIAITLLLRDIAPDTTLATTFEELIFHPWRSASKIAQFLGRTLDVEKMEAARMERTAQCAEGLMEIDLLERHEGRFSV